VAAIRFVGLARKDAQQRHNTHTHKHHSERERAAARESGSERARPRESEWVGWSGDKGGSNKAATGPLAALHHPAAPSMPKKCDGDGYFRKKCKKCDGDGWIWCQSCDDDGVYRWKNGKPVQCRRCKGNTKLQCRRCDGSGEIVSSYCDGCKRCGGEHLSGDAKQSKSNPGGWVADPGPVWCR
jgi:hypothetical protein